MKAGVLVDVDEQVDKKILKKSTFYETEAN
jgi:hypothetical protein